MPSLQSFETKETSGELLKDQFDKVRSIIDGRLVQRLFDQDIGLWLADTENNISFVKELSDRLNWLAAPRLIGDLWSTYKNDVEQIQNYYESVVLFGMGGSSLSTFVFRQYAKSKVQPNLTVLDTTCPKTVENELDALDFKRTLFIASSKSGTTLETLALFNYVQNICLERELPFASHFAVITDPNSPLDRFAKQKQLKFCFLGDQNVGGRYSALTAFGLIPAAILGCDVAGLQEALLQYINRLCTTDSPTNESAILFASLLADLSTQANVALTVVTDKSHKAQGWWLEQLLAESLGKNGQGIVPVVMTYDEFLNAKKESIGAALLLDQPGIDPKSIEKLGKQCSAAGKPHIIWRTKEIESLSVWYFNMEIATALAGSLMGINPFDQPDVESTKQKTRALLDKPERMTEPLGAGGIDVTKNLRFVGHSRKTEGDKVLGEWLADDSFRYLALLAFLHESDDSIAALGDLRSILWQRFSKPVSVGYGPRYLHSCGQLHKGGPAQAKLLLLLGDYSKNSIHLPEPPIELNQLFRAQAAGDFEALQQSGRDACLVEFRNDDRICLEELMKLCKHFGG